MNDNLFEIKNLNVYAKGNKIIDNLNFKIKKKITLALLVNLKENYYCLSISNFLDLETNQSGDIYFSNSNLNKFSIKL